MTYKCLPTPDLLTLLSFNLPNKSFVQWLRRFIRDNFFKKISSNRWYRTGQKNEATDIKLLRQVLSPGSFVYSEASSPMDRETEDQSCQRLEKWYLTSPCLKLCFISYVSKVILSNPGKRVAPPNTSVW